METVYIIPANNLEEAVKTLNSNSNLFKIRKVTNTDLEKSSFDGFTLKGTTGCDQLSYLRYNAVSEGKTLKSYTYMVYDKETEQQIGFFTLRLVDHHIINRIMFDYGIGVELQYFLLNQSFKESPAGIKMEKTGKISVLIFEQCIKPLFEVISLTSGSNFLFVLSPKKKLSRFFQKELHFKSTKFGIFNSIILGYKGRMMSKYLFIKAM